MKIILHIGSTKTGSSALQKFLYTNRSELLTAGIYYPDIGVDSNAQHLLASMLHPNAWMLHRPDLTEEGKRVEIFEEMVESILGAASNNKCDVLVLSSEYLWGVFEPRFYDCWSRLLTSGEATFYAVIRRQDNWLQSSYLQALKYGEMKSFDDWMFEFENDKTGGSDYFSVIDAWARNVPNISVKISIYEEIVASGSVFSGFLNLCGMSDVPIRFVGQGVVENPSPTPESAQLLLDVNRSDMPEETKRSIRGMILNYCPERKIGADINIIESSKRIKILEDYEIINKKIIDSYGSGLSAPLFKTPWPKLS